MGDDYPGLRSASTPGYPYFAPLGLKSRKKAGPFGRLRDRGSFGTVSELASVEPAESFELADKLRDRGFVRSVSLPALNQPNPSNWPLSSRGRDFFTVSELAELADINCSGTKFPSKKYQSGSTG